VPLTNWHWGPLYPKDSLGMRVSWTQHEITIAGPFSIKFYTFLVCNPSSPLPISWVDFGQFRLHLKFLDGNFWKIYHIAMLKFFLKSLLGSGWGPIPAMYPFFHCRFYNHLNQDDALTCVFISKHNTQPMIYYHNLW